VAIEYRWADSRYDRLPALAADLVRRGVSMIATGSNINAAMAAKAATMTIPIVFLTGADPVRDGLVNSLNRPGGNLAGVMTLNVEIVPKRQSPLRATADRDPPSARHGVLLRAGRWDMRFLFVNELEDSFSGLVLRANRGTGCYRGHRSDSRKWGFNGRVALQKSLAVHVGLGSFASFRARSRYDRFTPMNGHTQQ